jgi:hypothetical protein
MFSLPVYFANHHNHEHVGQDHTAQGQTERNDPNDEPKVHLHA